MITIGVDFSKKTSAYCVLNDKGDKIKRCKLENKPELMAEFFESLPKEEPRHLAMEATRNWGLYHDAIVSYVDHFDLGHPKKMKAITESETKNDPNDAELIARLAHSGFLPKAHVSSLETRQLRSLLRGRGFWVNQRKAIRNQVHILVDRNLWPCDKPKNFKNLFCLRGLKWLRELKLPEKERFILDQCLAAFEHLTQKILKLESFIQEQPLTLPGIKYLKTVPGFRTGRVNALTVLAESDQMSRFRRARHYAHYAGLVPSEHSSGDKHRTGRLVRGANMHLRHAFIESTFAAIRCDQGLKAYYKQVKLRSGAGSAIIATARKLSYAVYAVLKEKRNYRMEALPQAAVLSA
jgi:transposase